MKNSTFRCKQFSLEQDKCAMKIGTDGILLGAWANCDRASNILDIGSGTGIIALQMAQRNLKASIVAVEIDKLAFEQATSNFKNSKWSKRLTILNQDINLFQIDSKFDLIISNPPFFEDYFAENTARNKARSQNDLSFQQLINKTAELLSATGLAAIVIPFQAEKEFIALANMVELYPCRITRVKGKVGGKIVRSLIEFSFKQSDIEVEELCIEITRHNYTKQYIDLVKPFYLKM